jgi:nitrite reductase/ring-hydroxylating ferredoxin subunit
MGTRFRTDAVDALLADRAPHWRSVDAEADTLGMAIALAAARPGATVVRPRFVSDLRRCLAQQLDATDCRESHPAMGRRRVLKVVGVAAAAAVGGGVVERVGSRPQRGRSDKANVAADGAWQTVATSSELDDLGVLRFATPATVGFLTRSGGVLRAVSGVCTHQGCLLEYREGDQELACPCHRATFALTGDVRAHDVVGLLPPLPQLPVREQDGRIEVYLATTTNGAPKPKPLPA